MEPHYSHICFLLRFICNPKSTLTTVSQSFADMRRVPELLSCLKGMFRPGAQQGFLLRPLCCKRVSFSMSIYCPPICIFLLSLSGIIVLATPAACGCSQGGVRPTRQLRQCRILNPLRHGRNSSVILLFKMVPKGSAEMLSTVYTMKGLACDRERKHLCGGHFGCKLLAVGSILMSQQCMLNKGLLNRNTHKTRLCRDGLIKCRDQRLAGFPSPVFPLWTMAGFR